MFAACYLILPLICVKDTFEDLYEDEERHLIEREKIQKVHEIRARGRRECDGDI